MSDADADLEAEEEPEDLEENADEEQPEIEDEEMAEIDFDDIADEIEEEAGADSDDVDDDDASDDVQDDGADLPSPDDGETWGDMYVGTLTTLSNALIEEHGLEGAEKIDEDMARQLDLDQHLNEWLEQQGMGEDMPPGQALAVTTTAFLVMVAATKTDLPNQLIDELDL